MTNKLQNELQSKTIDWLRFPLAIAVVFIHMNIVVDMQGIDYSSLSGHDIYTVSVALVSHVLANIAVPCFFMFSGFLFFYKTEWNKKVYLNKIKSRTKTLIIPYVLWNIIAVFIFATLKLIKMDGSIAIYLKDLYDNGLCRIFWNYSVWGEHETNMLGWLIPHYGPYLVPLWFLRDLIIMVFLSPLVYWFVKYTKYVGIILLGILYYTKIGFIIPGFSTSLFLTAAFFFCLGAYFSVHEKNMVVSLRKGKLFWLLLAIVTLVLSTYYDGSEMKKYFSPLYVLSGVITAVNISSFFIERKKIKVSDTLSKASFFIYATHGILILSWTGRLFDKIFQSESVIILLIRYICVPLICVGICLSIYCLMKRFTPKILSLLTGNR
ncbi:MAG: acyltransferase [Prevotellaceae bacterium]|jgi:peptidoglycan/LPS O-acetylase OafA/YrhL|nr:acyltransferase [Prevotellaceae bacterium]